MDELLRKPNLLFLVQIRCLNPHIMQISRLSEKTFHNKLVNALTTIEIRALIDGYSQVVEEPPEISDCIKLIYYLNNHRHNNRVVHRENGPAQLCEHGEDWMFNGKHHRLEGPAKISLYKDDIDFAEKRREEWCVYGKRHRRKMPAVIGYDQSGKIITEEWWFGGVRHRGLDENKIHHPAIIRLSVDNLPTSTNYWYWHGRKHRLTGPAVIKGLLSNGDSTYFAWYKNGKYHRPDSFDFEGKPIRSNPTISGEHGTIKEWWNDGDLVMAENSTHIYNIKGSDIYMSKKTDEKATRLEKSRANSYMGFLRKKMNKMSELKDKQALKNDSLDLVTGAPDQ